MEIEQSVAAEITAIVSSWPGVTSGFGHRGELSFRLNDREIGHLHGNTVAHFFLERTQAVSLRAAGRVTSHPVFPRSTRLVARRIVTVADVADVVEIMRLNYERLAAGMVGPADGAGEDLRH